MSTADRVIIVGAGPVGLVCAYGLARVGVPVTVLEAEAAVLDSPRAMVYHWALHEDLQRLDLLDEIERRGFRKDDYGYRVHATGETVSYDLRALAGETPFPYNVHLGQEQLCAIILERLAGIDHVSVRWGVRVAAITQTADEVRVGCESDEGPDELGGTWAIACDGARSTVRRLLGVDFPGITWDTRFVATNVYFDFEAHGYPRSVFLMDDVHGAVIAKISDDGLWRVTYEEDLSLDEGTAAERVDDHFAAVLPGGGPYELARLAPYRVHQRSAERMRLGRVLLAGDAAHATNPTGGFGLTSGLFDAFALIDTLGGVLTGGADPSGLDAWATERKRIFDEVASPAATRMKQTVYDSDRASAERTCAELRRMIDDPDALHARLTFPARLRSAGLPAPSA